MDSVADRLAGTGLFGDVVAAIRHAVVLMSSADGEPADPFRGLYITDDEALALAHAAPDAAAFEQRLAGLGARVGLSALETAALATCVAPELSPHYGRLYGYLHDDVTHRWATPRLAARLLGGGPDGELAVLRCFDRDRRLRTSGAVRVLDDDATLPLEDRPARVAERLVVALLGTDLRATAEDPVRVVRQPACPVGREDTVSRLRAMLADGGDLPLLVAGADAELVLAAALGTPVLLLALSTIADPRVRCDALLRGLLDGCRIAVDGLADVAPDRAAGALAALRAWPQRPLLCARSSGSAAALGDLTVAVVEVPQATLDERRRAWSLLAGSDDVDDVAAKFRLSIADIGEAAAVARLLASARGGASPGPAELDEGARRASGTGLLRLATRLHGPAAWDDLVLPGRQRDLLRSICAYLRHRDRVLSDWGYDETVARDQGLKVLFSGDSGTGKTLAGRVLARELGLELFRIDLATVVSKYIGETEKNLDRIFSAAEDSNAILFFDEADALLGKRTEVSDAHDRHANIEVAYLLQRIESYPGAVILATNFRQNIDAAFIRRLDFIVDFPFPELADRVRLWRMLLPDAAPLADDVDVDFLGARFKLSGGAIRNCSVAAAFMAAEEGSAIGMDHLVRAVALEYGKLGRLTLEADFERFHGLVRHPDH
jgi:hypothetical protein